MYIRSAKLQRKFGYGSAVDRYSAGSYAEGFKSRLACCIFYTEMFFGVSFCRPVKGREREMAETQHKSTRQRESFDTRARNEGTYVQGGGKGRHL